MAQTRSPSIPIRSPTFPPLRTRCALEEMRSLATDPIAQVRNIRVRIAELRFPTEKGALRQKAFRTPRDATPLPSAVFCRPAPHRRWLPHGLHKRANRAAEESLRTCPGNAIRPPAFAR